MYSKMLLIKFFTIIYNTFIYIHTHFLQLQALVWQLGEQLKECIRDSGRGVLVFCFGYKLDFGSSKPSCTKLIGSIGDSEKLIDKYVRIK